MAASCMNLGPDYQRPDAGVKIPPVYQNDQGPAEPVTVGDQWWKEFNNPEIDIVAEKTLHQNLAIKAETYRALQARSQVILARSTRLPTVAAQGEASRDRSIATSIGDRETSTYNLALPTSFELDLWGKYAKYEEAAREDLLRSEETRLATAQSVVAEAISLYLEMEAIERRIQITEQSIQVYRQSLSFVENRYKRGLASNLELRQARRTLAEAESGLPSLLLDLGAVQQNLSVLMGEYPTTRPPRLQPDEYYKQMEPVPPGIPSQLLLRRPDIRAAEANLRALNASVGVALASRFPSITLTGSYGYLSDDVGKLFQPESLFWSLAGGILQPLFDGGALKAQQFGAEMAYQGGVVAYAETVLNAFGEVENALLTRREQEERRKHVLIFLDEARETQKAAEKRYSRGLTEYVNVFEAQQTRYQAEQNLVLTDLAIMTNRVALHRALGGGWAQPDELPALNYTDYLTVF